MQALGTITALVGLSAILLIPRAGLGQTAPVAPTADAILSRPVSPGTIALLVEHGTVPAVSARLSGALQHADPHTRAAASRVIFVLGLKSLVPAAAAALEVETDPSAAMEEARIVAHFGTASQADAILQGVLGLDPLIAAPVALVMAAARGVGALDYLDSVRKTVASESTLADFIRLASRGEHELLKAIVLQAVRSQDATLLTMVLKAARDAETPTDDLLVLALATDDWDSVKEAALSHFLSVWDGRHPVSEPLRVAITQGLATRPAQADVGTMLTREVAGRAVGRASRTDPEWNSVIAIPPVERRAFFMWPSVRRLLTNRELDAAGRALFKDSRALSRPNDDEPSFSKSERASASLVRTASGYPPGFLSSLFVEAGCNLRNTRDLGPGATGAEITLRNEGRALGLALLGAPAAPSCAHAGRVALMTYTADIIRLIQQNQRDLVILPFDADFVACQDASATPYVLAAETVDQRRIEPPRRTKDVRPVYPQGAIDARIQGIVILEGLISSTGCIARAHVLRTVDPRVDWAATRAVIGWKFSPTLLGGAVVPVSVTISVQFTLK